MKYWWFISRSSPIMLLLVLLCQCERKTTILALYEEDEITFIDETIDTITYDVRTDRNDIPPPPAVPWWTIDTEELTSCQRRLWVYLKKIYPINDSESEYQIYTVERQVGDLRSTTHLLNRLGEFFRQEFPQSYLYNTEHSHCPEEVGVDFFKKALGEPTCIGENYRDGLLSFSYFLKFRLRHGPCPYTHDQGREIGSYCSPFNTQYCTNLHLKFSLQDSSLLYIDFR